MCVPRRGAENAEIDYQQSEQVFHNRLGVFLWNAPKLPLYLFSDKLTYFADQLNQAYAPQAAKYASAVINTNCTIGHFQLFVSRFTTASVLMHCMAKT